MPGINEKKRLIIIGASGHGRVVADIASLNGFKDIVFLDDDDALNACGRYQVLGKADAAEKMDGVLFIAVGNAKIRKYLMTRFSEREFPILVHPNAVIANDVEIGEGSVVMAGSVINPGARLGRGIIANTCSSIDHDCVIGDFVHVSVDAHLCGTVKVEDSTWIGAGATISNNINICADCTIGAGTVVVKDICEPGTYIGVPASKVRNFS